MKSIDAHGTQVRLRAMVALGWSTWEIATRFHLPHPTVVTVITTIDPIKVRAGVAKQVAAVYENFSMQLPPARDVRAEYARQAIRRYAATLGWLPPLALDDEHIDDPTWAHGLDNFDVDDDVDLGYDEAAVLRRLNGDRTAPITHGDRLEIVRRGRRRGMSYSDLVHVCGLTKPERYIDFESIAS